MFAEPIRRQVRVPHDVLVTGPAAHFLEDVHRRPVLCKPTRPRMAQIVPVKILNPGFGQGGLNSMLFKQ